MTGLAKIGVWLLVMGMVYLLVCPAGEAEPGKAAMPGPSDRLVLTDKDNGRSINLRLGEVLTLRLEASPGTGYGWQVVQDDPALLAPLGKPVMEPLESGKLGAAEYQVFRFKAKAAGKGVLQLHYQRQWEKQKAPAKTFRVNFSIN